MRALLLTGGWTVVERGAIMQAVGSGDSPNVEDLETLDPNLSTNRSARPSRQRDGSRLPRARSGRSRQKSRLAIASALVLGAVAGGVVMWQLRASGSASTRRTLPLPMSQHTVVPNVIGMLPSDAEALLARWALAGSADDPGVPSERSRVVVAQEPGAGQQVAAGSIVDLRTQLVPQEVGPLFRSFGSITTPLGYAVMVCGEEAMPACGAGTILEFVQCTDALRAFFHDAYLNHDRRDDHRLRELTGRDPPSGDHWTWGCGRDFRPPIKIV